MSRWFRHYAGMMRDEKLVSAAVKAKQPVERVVWVWGAILESAAEINDGGRYEFDCGEAAYFLRCSEDELANIAGALDTLGRLHEGRICKWADRQYESDNSTERVRKHRASVAGDNPTVSSDMGNDRRNDTETLHPVAVTPPETETETEKKEIRRKAPRRISYPPRFTVFWEAYPTDKLMSKPEALGEWQNLSPEDQEAAINALPAWKAATAKLGPDHRIIHACRFLKKRRFDGFAEAAAKQAEFAEAASTKVYVKYGSDAGDAWEADFRLRGKIPPRDQGGGWWFPSEFPENVSRQTSEQAA